MALAEKTRVQIEIDEEDRVAVRRNRIIYDDVTGEIVSGGNYHREVLIPGDDYSGQPVRVRGICDRVFKFESVQMHIARKDLANKEQLLRAAQRRAKENPSPENEAAEAQAEADVQAAEATAEAAEAAWEAQYDT